eukprot:CAMPEP_0205909342 /NCGR_PEP_ID=MMETSP1325-20131115/3806_1 /ASSEMBLY_ACC=CAM_ASM_000708 /TAXON_ID=236786 /ORGANISM="Florenciella sp., Strain RCC1007" /LENGTH=122 /DNA_ID=CAMNT_0053275627 /DNA_START=454 /DNA_END=822 /DNA_ORIENTATION=+
MSKSRQDAERDIADIKRHQLTDNETVHEIAHGFGIKTSERKERDIKNEVARALVNILTAEPSRGSPICRAGLEALKLKDLRKLIDQHALPVKKNVGGRSRRTKAEMVAEMAVHLAAMDWVRV